MAKAKSKDKVESVKDKVSESKDLKKGKGSESQKLESKIENPKSKIKPAEKLAKSGKRSKKVQTEAAEQAAKAEKKVISKKKKEEKAETTKVVQKPHVKHYSKNQKAARELLEKDKLYTLAEAVELLPKLSKVKFDATAELHASLNIDPKQADQMLRASASLPAGTGKNVRVAVLAGESDAEAAKKAGADITDAEMLLGDIGKGKFDFEVLIATPEKMAELGRHAKVLGPKGLMPSPKNNTVTPNPASVVAEIKKGRVELKNDPAGIVHLSIGKLSFKQADLLANAKTAVSALYSARPTGVKGVYVKSLYITSSMSPSIKLDAAEALKESKE
jgi:large subunit ribosomal protein L1